jgi:protein-disulfide isomerase
MGPEGAPITLTVFSDFQCAFCREEAKMLRANLPTAYPDAVRLVFMDFPLIQIHDWAKPAAIAGRCLAAQSNDSFWQYHDWIFESQKQITAANFGTKLQEWAQAQGHDGLRLQQCMQSPEIDAAVTASFQKAISMGLNSTPTIFVNGRQLGGKLEWQTLSQVIDAELEYLRNPPATVKPPVGDKDSCCTVELPGLFPK